MAASANADLTAEYENAAGGVAWRLLARGRAIGHGRETCFIAAQAAVERETAAFHALQTSMRDSLLHEFAGRKVDGELVAQIVDRATALIATRRQLV